MKKKKVVLLCNTTITMNYTLCRVINEIKKTFHIQMIKYEFCESWWKYQLMKSARSH